MTMIHTDQIQPEVFFSEKNIKLFKRELEKENIRIERLERSVVVKKNVTPSLVALRITQLI